MNSSITHITQNDLHTNTLVKELYEAYAKKLFAYTRKNYSISEDDTWTLIYKTLYKIADVNDNYDFESEQKRSAFIFKTHINYLRNYFRDNKSFEARHFEVDLNDDQFITKEEAPVNSSLQLSVLQKQLDNLEEWERILLLMRGQDMPYSEIAKFVHKPEKQLKVYYARLKKQLLISMNEEIHHLNTLKDGK